MKSSVSTLHLPSRLSIQTILSELRILLGRPDRVSTGFSFVLTFRCRFLDAWSRLREGCTIIFLYLSGKFGMGQHLFLAPVEETVVMPAARGPIFHPPRHIESSTRSSQVNSRLHLLEGKINMGVASLLTSIGALGSEPVRGSFGTEHGMRAV